MEHLIIPENYSSALNLHDTQIGIKTVKDFFQSLLVRHLNLLRVSAPLFVDPASGMNDNLNGYERPVSFGILEQNDYRAEVVQSLAKWKRDETTDNIHSIFVDQWDWEKIIDKKDRNLETLKATVRDVYKALRKTEMYMAIQYDYIEEILPREIFFITTQELADMFPDNTPKEREYFITKAKGAVCIMQIGDKLENGEPHDGRTILFWTSPWSCPLWVSAWTKRPCCPSWKKPAAPSAQSFRSRKQSSMKSCLTPSAAVSVSPVSVCSSCARLILEKYMFPCGLRKCRKKLLKAVFHFCKIESRDQIEYTFFLNTEK